MDMLNPKEMSKSMLSIESNDRAQFVGHAECETEQKNSGINTMHQGLATLERFKGRWAPRRGEQPRYLGQRLETVVSAAVDEQQNRWGKKAFDINYSFLR